MWKDLISVLQKILLVYEEILVLSEKKNLALRHINVKEVDAIVKREQALVKTIGTLEMERKNILHSIEQTEKVNIKKMLDATKFCDKKSSNQIEIIHQGLKDLLFKIEKSNKENACLTRQTLELMNYKINILSETSVGTTYAKFGQESVSATKMFEIKA